MNENKELLQKAKNYAFLLLKFRQRSEKEIYGRLKKKKFTEETIKETITFLKDKEFIDDELFAKTWIESRLRKPLGLRRIRQELKAKGVDNEIIENKIQASKDKYCEEDVVLKIAKEKLGKIRGIEQPIIKRRLYSYLLRRGFSPDIVMDVIKRLCKHIS